MEYLRIIVDGDHVGSRKIKLEAGQRSYVLADKLQPGQHSIEAVKETYSGRGRFYLYGLEAVEGKLVPQARPAPRLRIQFYGDSNLAGHSLEHEKNKGGSVYSGCHFTFAGIVSRMLEAEY